MNKLDPNEFRLMRDYIEKHCGIHLGDEKAYLVESRLTTLMAESGCKTFTEFYYKALGDTTNALRDKMIDMMTTNETLWLRDSGPYAILEETLLRQFTTEMQTGKRSTIRIWSAASSTGQEPYSIAMIALEMARKGLGVQPAKIEIIASDISPTVLFLAKTGRYDSLAMSRGLPEDLKVRYFTPAGKVWAIKDEVKKMVTFKKLNLQEDFSSLGRMDIVFCRNVLIYFSDEFKRDVMRRIAALLRPAGYFFVGASESVSNYSSDYTMLSGQRGLYYKVKA